MTKITTPRGWSNLIPAPNCWSNCPSPQAIYNTMGTPCPSTHPNNSPPPCPPPQPTVPGITPAFTGGIQNGFNQFGCQFVYKRTDIQRNKMRLLQNSINPNSPTGQSLFPQMMNWTPGTHPVGPIPAPMNLAGPSIGIQATPGETPAGLTTIGPNIPTPLPIGPQIPSILHTIMTTPIQAAGTVGTNPNWQQLLENRINWLTQFSLTNCTGGPTPGPGTVICSTCQGGYPVTNMFPLQPPGGGPSCPAGWTTGTGNPCQTTPPIPPIPPIPPTPPNPPYPPWTPPAGMVSCDNCAGGYPISQVFPGTCPPNWIPSGSGNPCGSTTGPTPPPPTPTGPGFTNGFTSY